YHTDTFHIKVRREIGEPTPMEGRGLTGREASRRAPDARYLGCRHPTYSRWRRPPCSRKRARSPLEEKETSYHSSPARLPPPARGRDTRVAGSLDPPCGCRQASDSRPVISAAPTRPVRSSRDSTSRAIRCSPRAGSDAR